MGGADAVPAKDITSTVNDLMADLAKAENTPVYPGYALRGWSMKPSIASDIDADLLKTAPPVIGSVTLYAHWRAKDITMSWDMGTWTGAGAPSAPDPTTVTFSDESIGNAYPSYYEDAMRTGRGEGYAWQGWYSTDEKGDKVTKVLATSKIPYESTRYTAFWTVAYTWLANDGVYTTTTQDSGGTAKVAPPQTSPSRTGYDFAGWYSATDHATPLKAQDGTYPLAIAPAAYEAHWEPHQITLTLDANGGAFAGEDAQKTQDIKAAAGSTVALPGASDVSRDGYEFAGWYTTVECADGTEVTSSVMPDEDDVYYAKWAGATVTFHWDSDGGSAVADTYREYGPTAKLPMPLANPTRAGYKFAGWFTDKTYGTQVSASTAMPPTTQTFYAKWQGKTVSITWNVRANEGTWQGGANNGTSNALVTTQTYGDAGNKVVLPTEAQGKPVKFGNAFAGWYTTASAADGSTQVDANTALPQGTEGFDTVSVTYYARFNDAPSTVTFDLDEGKWNMPSNVSVSASVREELMPTIKDGTTNAEPPTKAGYTFEGFYFAEGGVEIKYYNADLSSATRWDRAAATTLKAKWTPWVYTLNFNRNGAVESVPSSITSVTLAYDGSYAVPDNIEFTHTDGPWLGWALDKDALKPDFEPHESITGEKLARANGGLIIENRTTIPLYAVFELIMSPKSELRDGEEAFYLYTDADAVVKAGLGEKYKNKFLYTDDIKAAADDIAEKKSDSKYYDFFNRVMQNDVHFTTNWNYYVYNNSTSPVQRTSVKGANTIAYKVRLLDMMHDEKMNGEKVAFTFQFVNLLYNTYQMNAAITSSKSWVPRLTNLYNYVLFDSNLSNNTNDGGWGKSELRGNMNPGRQQSLHPNNTDSNAVWDLAPKKVQDAITPVRKRYYSSTTAIAAGGAPSESEDYMFVPSYAELVQPGTYLDKEWAKLQKEGTVYWYYNHAGVAGDKAVYKTTSGSAETLSTDYANNKALLKYHILEDGSVDEKTYGTTYLGIGSVWDDVSHWEWWERSIPPTATTAAAVVHYDGTAYTYYNLTHYDGVAPCFCF